MNNKKSQSKFLSIPKSKAKVASSENCSKDKEDSDDTGGFGKYVSARASDRSERSIGLHEERGKDVQPLAFKPPRNRVASGTFRHEFTPPASLSQAKFQHPPKSSKSKDNLRSSVTCGRNFTNTDLPPISKKEASKVTKYPSVRVFPTAN